MNDFTRIGWHNIHTKYLTTYSSKKFHVLYFSRFFLAKTVVQIFFLQAKTFNQGKEPNSDSG